MRLVRIEGGNSPGTTYAPAFHFRNRSGKTVAGFEHRIDFFDLEARTPTGEKLPVKRRSRRVIITIPIAPVEVTEDEQIEKAGSPILIGGFTDEAFEEAAFLETSNPLDSDTPVAAVNAKTGESIRLRFHLSHPARLDGPKLTSGEIRLIVGDNAEIGASFSANTEQAVIQSTGTVTVEGNSPATTVIVSGSKSESVKQGRSVVTITMSDVTESANNSVTWEAAEHQMRSLEAEVNGFGSRLDRFWDDTPLPAPTGDDRDRAPAEKIPSTETVP